MASWMINDDKATFQMELSDSALLEILKYDIMAMFFSVYLNVAYFLLMICARMWAGIQRKVLLQLTPFTRESTRAK